MGKKQKKKPKPKKTRGFRPGGLERVRIRTDGGPSPEADADGDIFTTERASATPLGSSTIPKDEFK